MNYVICEKGCKDFNMKLRMFGRFLDYILIDVSNIHTLEKIMNKYIDYGYTIRFEHCEESFTFITLENKSEYFSIFNSDTPSKYDYILMD